MLNCNRLYFTFIDRPSPQQSSITTPDAENSSSTKFVIEIDTKKIYTQGLSACTVILTIT
jgi:hypothetical protein